MRLAPALALVLLLACKGSSEKKPAPSAGSDATALDAAAVAVPRADLSFVRGSIYVTEEHDGKVVARRLDPATSTWVGVDGGAANLFPSARFRGGLLAIATEGASEADHVEQLAVVGATGIERLGPQARMVRNPVVSADGTTVVVETSERSFRDLYRIDGAGTVRLTDNREGNFEPALSPDGKIVAFASSRDGDSEIYRMPLRGGAATRLTAFHKDDWSPRWSPDGATLAFLSDREGSPRLFFMAPDGTNLRRATAETDPSAVEDHPSWSPDGTTVAFLRSAGGAPTVVRLDVATGKTTSVTPDGFADTDFAWSPDGGALAVMRHPVTATRDVGPGDVTLVRLSDNVTTPTGSPPAAAFLRWLP